MSEDTKLVMPSEFDYTMLSAFQRCQRYYYYRIVRGLVGKKPQTAPEFGRCIHLALDDWYTNHNKDTALAKFNDNFVENPEDDKRTKAVGTKLLNLYFEKYAHEPFKVLASEQEFSFDFFGVKIIGRIDKIIDWDGAIMVMDHKTTSRLGYDFFNKIKPNIQFDGYILGARSLGFEKCNGILIDALLVAKGLITPAQLAKLTPLARMEDFRTEEDLEEWKDDVSNILGQISGSYNVNHQWCRSTDSCCDFIECPYRKICKEQKDIRERVIEMDFKVEHWSPKKEVIDG